MQVFFYPHSYLRDRHLDTIRRWPVEEVVNLDLLTQRQGTQVTRERALLQRGPLSWKQVLPLVNVKPRPSGIDPDVAVYLWGAITTSGPFIVELDNPYALVGYNLRAMPIWQPVLRRVLLSARCLEIRCMSEACRESLAILFGQKVARKARVVYPYMAPRVTKVPELSPDGPRILFVATQFEIKGGAALLRAFAKVREVLPEAKLDVITHLPVEYASLAHAPGLTIHEARFTRQEIWRQFMARSDVLVHPTYVESFGMVLLEALGHGLAVVATDVYASREMVCDGVNGRLLAPPISIWDGYRPAALYYDLERAASKISALDTGKFELALAESIIDMAACAKTLLACRQASLRILMTKFSPGLPE